MDWDLAIKRNSEVLIEIVADLFAMLGLVGEATVSRLPWPTYRAVLRILAARRIRPAPPHRRCGAGPCGCSPRVTSEAGGGIKTRKGGYQRSPPSSSSIRRPHRAAAPENSQAAWPAHPHVQRR